MSGFSLMQLDAEITSHVANARKALVQIRTGPDGTGAGVIVHGNGLIVSNAHVVRRRAARVILSDGEALPARLVAYDERLDLAALVVEVRGLASLPIGDSRLLRPGSLVVALGHPWGVVAAATAGMVIAVGRPPERVPYAGDLIQVGLHLRPGHSGGPMLNVAGELVGINTMIAGPHVGLAVPASTLSRFLKESLRRQDGGRAPRRPEAVPA